VHSRNRASARICWLIRGDEGYGVRRSSRTLLEALRRSGYDARVVSLSDGPFAAECQGAGFDVETLQVWRLRPIYDMSPLQRARRRIAYFYQLLHSREAVARTVARLDPQLLHVRKSALVGFAGYAAKRLGVPCLWHMPDEVDPRRALGLYRTAFQAMCLLYGIRPVGNSQYTARRFGRWPVRADVLHLGVDEAHFDPRCVPCVARSTLGIPDGHTVAAVVGRLTPVKGQHRLVEALTSSAVPAALHLVFVGGDFDREYARRLREEVAARGLSHRCHFVGQVADTRPWYALSDFVINSRVNAEPFGLAVVEAMMMAKPVLVLALGGPAETVLDGETGWHIRNGNSLDWAHGMARAYHDRPAWPHLGACARHRAVTRFSSRQFAENYLKLVSGLL
jgi:glycosyltransferase involved in cell wall biosynthesis